MSYYESYKRRDSVRSNRYRNCSILKDSETQETLVETRDVEEIPKHPADKFHTVQPNEVGRLDLISYRYYKNPLYWWVIAQANHIYDPISHMQSGMLLRIPTVETLYGYKGILL